MMMRGQEILFLCTWTFIFFHVHDLRALNDVKKIRMMMMPMMKSTFK